MKKNHHYIPKVYLNYFTDPNKCSHENEFLWVFEDPHTPPYKKSPKNVCAEKYFYSIDDDDLEPDHELIENFFHGMENSITRILRELSKKQVDFNNVEKRYRFAKFISFLNYRTAQAREHFRIQLQNSMKSKIVDKINDAGGYQQWVKKDENNLADISEDDFLKSFNGMKIRPKKAMSADFMMNASKMMLPLLADRNWTFYKTAYDNVFVTSDSPVVLHNKTFEEHMVPGVALKETDFVFPINSTLCLVASYHTEERYVTASREIVISINQLIANKSNKYVFGSSNDFVKLFGSYP
jgi:hypothetical protein